MGDQEFAASEAGLSCTFDNGFIATITFRDYPFTKRLDFAISKFGEGPVAIVKGQQKVLVTPTEMSALLFHASKLDRSISVADAHEILTQIYCVEVEEDAGTGSQLQERTV